MTMNTTEIPSPAQPLLELLNRAAIHWQHINGPTPVKVIIRSIVEDSRQVQSGSLFVAIRGSAQDGHQYISDAVQRGAVAVVVTDREVAAEGVPAIWVKDGALALARLAAGLYGLPELQRRGEMTLTGITGTNGKSTTCYLIRNMLREHGRPCAMLGTVKYDLVGREIPAPWTTPPASLLPGYLLEAHRHGARHAVMETSSHALVQRRTAGLRYAVAIFTNITGDHLDYHQDFESYLQAKKILFDELTTEATAIINMDDPHAERLVTDCAARVVRFGFDPRAEVRASNLECTIQQSRFLLHADGQSLPVQLPLVGRHNVSNALAMTAAGRTLGLSLTEITASLNRATSIAGRLQRAEPAGHPFSVFVDYAHTDDALINVLSALRSLTTGRLWCLFGCGGDRDRTKRPRMAAAAAHWADQIVVTSDNPRTEQPQSIIDQIMTGFPEDARPRVTVKIDRRQAIELALAYAQPNDVLLIAGKGHEDYQIIGTQKFHFDDVEVVREFLQSSSAGE
ncbi:MAG: UDP-N-acetylmuramoyl-L-alanyl-D-glutamate--2,6-diaminopimelate ligase [Phycisphaerae bacterium]|nr:UDP-N-acetylmuramoyl-L-alanyl-D-glutamate--2,6-diaminopimelate ligase [Phycisphaerae bacterium]